MVDCPCFENSSVRETFGTFAVWLNHSGNNPRLIRFATVAMILALRLVSLKNRG